MGFFDNIRSKTDSTTARVLFGAVVVVLYFLSLAVVWEEEQQPMQL